MNNIEDDNLVIIPCPPLSDYKEQPKDQSLCTAESCPFCKKEMWLSEKKKEWIKISTMMDKTIHLACYHCITEQLTTNEKLRKSLLSSKHFRI